MSTLYLIYHIGVTRFIIYVSMQVLTIYIFFLENQTSNFEVNNTNTMLAELLLVAHFDSIVVDLLFKYIKKFFLGLRV